MPLRQHPRAFPILVRLALARELLGLVPGDELTAEFSLLGSGDRGRSLDLPGRALAGGASSGERPLSG